MGRLIQDSNSEMDTYIYYRLKIFLNAISSPQNNFQRNVSEWFSGKRDGSSNWLSLKLDYTRRARVAPNGLFVFGTLAWRHLTYLAKVIIDCNRLPRIRWFNLNTYFCVIITYFEQVKFWIKNVHEIHSSILINSPSTHVLSFWRFISKFTEKPRISRFLPRIRWFVASAHGTRSDGRSDGRTVGRTNIDF